MYEEIFALPCSARAASEENCTLYGAASHVHERVRHVYEGAAHAYERVDAMYEEIYQLYETISHVYEEVVHVHERVSGVYGLACEAPSGLHRNVGGSIQSLDCLDVLNI